MEREVPKLQVSYVRVEGKICPKASLSIFGFWNLPDEDPNADPVLRQVLNIVVATV